MFIFKLRQNLINGHNKGSKLYCTRVFVIPSSIPFNILAICPIPFSASSIIFLLFLLLFGLLYPFYCCQCVLNIYILLHLQEHFRHRFGRILSQGNHELPEFQSSFKGFQLYCIIYFVNLQRFSSEMHYI